VVRLALQHNRNHKIDEELPCKLVAPDAAVIAESVGGVRMVREKYDR
jgi:hypothetical protein